MNFSTRWHGKLLGYKEKKRKKKTKQNKFGLKLKEKKKIEKEDCC